MKKSVNVILTLIPFALIAVFTAVPVVMTVYGSFFDINAEFVGFDNYAALLLSGASITAAAKAFLAAAIGFFADTLYVFCAVLGIGGIKNKWIRMLMLFAVGTGFISLSAPLSALYVILIIFLFPQKTGARHALRAALAFTALRLIMCMRVMDTSFAVNVFGVGMLGTGALSALKIIPAAAVGLLGGKALLYIKDRAYTEEGIGLINYLGNICALLFAAAAVIGVVSALKAVGFADADNAFGDLALYSVTAICITAAILAVTPFLVSALDKRAVFMIVCAALALNSVISAYITVIIGTAYPLIRMLMMLTEYMMIIALTLSVFARGKTMKAILPALAAVLMPLFSGTVSFALSLQSSSAEDFSGYIYSMSAANSAKTVIGLLCFVLICAGIAAATVLRCDAYRDKTA
ncbi:MAG: hypothetical protein LUF26_05575 [Firmicutes bacterium]|nr:hypothetical protein [Bacillota bacterium]